MEKSYGGLLDFQLLKPGLKKRQLNTVSLFNVPDLLASNGFVWKSHGELTQTYCGSKLDSESESFLGEIKNVMGEFEALRSSRYRQEKRKCFQEDDQDYNLFSASLEALIAYLCIFHLGALSAEFGVYIEDAPDGGDFDCIANFNNDLLFFEVKSGRVPNLEPDTAANFLKRHQFLAPKMSLLLIDFNGVTRDQIKALFKGQRLYAGHLVEALHAQDGSKFNIFALQHNIFVVDVQKGDLLRNIREVLKLYRRFKSFAEQSEFHQGKNPEWFGYSGSWFNLG